MNSRDWLKTDEGRAWLRKKKGLEEPPRSQEDAEHLVLIIDQFKASKRARVYFHMPKWLSKADQKLVTSRALSELQNERQARRPSPSRAREMIDQFIKEKAQAL